MNVFGKFFEKESDYTNLEGKTRVVVDQADAVMQKGLASSMKLEHFQRMSAEEFELMRATSALYDNSKKLAIDYAIVFDMIPDMAAELKTTKKLVEHLQAQNNELLEKINKLLARGV